MARACERPPARSARTLLSVARHRTGPVVAAVGISLVLGGPLDIARAAPGAPGDASLAEQVKATERAFAATLARRDLAAFATFLSDEALFFSKGGVLRGRQAIVQGWRRFYEGASAPFSWEPERVEVIDSGTLALSSGPVRDPAGRPIATFNSIWRREKDGAWRILFDKGEAACAEPPGAPTALHADRLSQLPQYVATALQAWHAPGIAVAVVKDGRVVLAQGFGVRALGGRAPVDAHTRFATASLTKTFTAAAAGQQVAAGRLAWDEPIAPRLPGFALRDPKVTAELSLRDVLSHRSGLDEAADLLWMGTGYDQGEVLARLAAVRQAAPLRTTFSYSNVLYSAAGRLLAQSAGVSWQELVRTRLLEPAGMRDSGLGVPRAADGNVAAPHAERDGVLRVIAPRDVDNIAPAAALYSSAADLARWLLVLLNRGILDGKRVLAEQTVDTLLTPQVLVGLLPFQKALYPESHFLAQGLGFMLQDYRGHLIAWGTGGIDGTSCSLALLPKEQLGVVVLTNVPWTGLPEGLVFWILDGLLGDAGKDSGKDWSAVRLALSHKSRARQAEARRAREGLRESTSWPLPPAQLVGRYRSELLGDAVIEGSGSRAGAGAGHTAPATLSLRIAKSLRGTLEPWRASALRFRPEDLQLDPELCTWTLGPDGSVRSIVLGEWGEFSRVGPLH
ncbi:MAG: serine hydrolase [Polyangia bacterium]